MPTLRILTNSRIADEDREPFLRHVSARVAEMLGKPESYVMVVLEDGRDLFFGGTGAPAAYLELKSLGLAESKSPEYSRLLCDLLTERLGIPADRVYIEMASPPRHLFGWNGGTF